MVQNYTLIRVISLTMLFTISSTLIAAEAQEKEAPQEVLKEILKIENENKNTPRLGTSSSADAAPVQQAPAVTATPPTTRTTSFLASLSAWIWKKE